MLCNGESPKGFPFPYDEDDLYFNTYLGVLDDTVEDLIYEGYTHFISGMAAGVDLDFASTVFDLSGNFEGIILESALPYSWTPPEKMSNIDDMRDFLIDVSQIKTVVSPQYFRGCMQKRNRYMVDKADLVLAVWNGEMRGGTWYTINYAIKKGKPIRYIMLNELSLKDKEKHFDRLSLSFEIKERLKKEEDLYPNEYI